MVNIVVEYLSFCPHIVGSFNWLQAALDKNSDHPLATIIRLTEIIWKSDPSYRNPDLADLDVDLAEVEGTPGLSSVTSNMSVAANYFDHRASIWFAAKYKRAGLKIQFIPESSGKKTPDLSLSDDKAILTAFLEVKHAGLKTPIELIIRKIQTTPSRYSVRLMIEAELSYSNQAENLARTVTDMLRNLSESDDVEQFRNIELPGIGKCELIRHQDGEEKMTGLMITWNGGISIPKIYDRLSQLIDKAREQLTDYSPHGINIVGLYVDDDSIKSDIVETTLLKEPGLFNSPEYLNLTAVKYVRQMVGHQESLFINERNDHVKNGEVGKLRL